MYWVPDLRFDFKQFYRQKDSRPSRGEKDEKALIARASTSKLGGTTVNQSPNPKVDYSKPEDQGSLPPLCNQEWEKEKKHTGGATE